MASVNRVILLGNLGRDAELKYTPSGHAVCSLNMATTERWIDKQGQTQEKTEWHRVQLWGKPAESLAEYLVKGKQIYLEGKLQTRSWDDKDGNKKYITEIKADRVVLLGGGGERGGRRRETGEDEDQAYAHDTATAGPSANQQPLTDDDIPFVWLMPFVGITAAMLSGLLYA